MQAASAQLRQDVCGLPLPDTQACNILEAAQDAHSLHLCDLQELGLSPNGTSDDYPDSTDTQQQQQQQRLNDSSDRGADTHLDNRSSAWQQQRNTPQRGEQQERNAASSEHHRHNTQGRNRSAVECGHAGRIAALGAPTAVPLCSSTKPALSIHQQQVEKPKAAPDALRTADKSIQQVDADMQSGAISSREFGEPARHEQSVVDAAQDLLRAAGEHHPPETQVHSACLDIMSITGAAPCRLHHQPSACL